MDQIVSYRDLEVWPLAMTLVDLVIADTRNMPRMEFDLTRQMRRAAVSIPSNICAGLAPVRPGRQCLPVKLFRPVGSRRPDRFLDVEPDHAHQLERVALRDHTVPELVVEAHLPILDMVQ